MRRIALLITTLALTMSGMVFSPAQAKVTKPSAPTISAISSSAVKKGKVNVKVTIALPTSNGGSKITGSRVTAGGKTCTIAKTKTSCTIKSIKNGKALKISAKSKNKKGFSSRSTSVAYTAGASAWPTTPVANVISDTPAASAPVAGPAPLTCATGGTCVVGNTGPGGGIVYYVDSVGFSCGPTLEAICNYLEVAPSGWNIGADPLKVWATGNSSSGNAIADVDGNTGGGGGVPITNDATAYNNALGIGLGLKNSMAIVAQNGLAYSATTNNYAAGAARAYGGGSKNDWYLPTSAELNLLCQWGRNVPQVVGTACTGGELNTGTGVNGVFVDYYYWSSSEWIAIGAWSQFFYNGIQTGANKRFTGHVRPVRAF
jgi:Protein of unknown function (DUF1566)